MNPYQNVVPFLLSGSQQEHQYRRKEPPLRVRVAIELLNTLSSKTMERAAISESQIQTIDGQKLTTAECNLQATAANLLNDYLLGAMKPDHWEKEKGGNLPIDQPGIMTRCFSCSINSPREDCPMCRGTGTCLVYPNLVSE